VCDPALTDCSGACIDLTKDNFSHCGSCNNSCGDESICTVDSCGSGKCTNLSGALSCGGGDTCKKSDCDAKTGCDGNNYGAAEIEDICVQVKQVSWDANTQCLYCDNASDKFCATKSISDDGDDFTCTQLDCEKTNIGVPTTIVYNHSSCGAIVNSPDTCHECVADPMLTAVFMNQTTGCHVTQTTKCR
jgi:hypothetical protein